MFKDAMTLAIAEARKFIGATAPNPPVGAAVLDIDGNTLAVAAHERAGTPHAEARALELCAERGLSSRIHTVLVTLEPCNHQGRTPPCTQAILRTAARRVVFGARDPNPIARGGAETLRAAGLEVLEGVVAEECEELIAPFKNRLLTGLPWITIKTAYTSEGSMIPPCGQKTFTSAESLKVAHELRKRADAVLTGSGTILSDDPKFTVRHVADHPGKKRWLVVMDRRKQVPEEWTRAASERGFQILRPASVEEGLQNLGANGCLEVLVEAGPTLSEAILKSGLWNRQVRIRQGAVNGGVKEADTLEILTNSTPFRLR